MTIRVYKMTHDNGGAPCVSHGLLSLAICKPAIRRCASVGDFVLGFAGQDLPPANRLVYAMRVTDKNSWCDYAINYPFRMDCIYKCENRIFSNRKDAKFKCNMDRHLGPAPTHRDAFVLLSSDFRYFGRCDEIPIETLYPIVHAAVAPLGQGHLKDHLPPLQNELEKLIDYVWKTFPEMETCRPTNPGSTECDRQPDESEENVSRSCGRSSGC
jgi:hypothetical protein